ncbi:MAG: hypothetical protein ACWGN1_04010, partial [Desulfobulbales bacterium]
ILVNGMAGLSGALLGHGLHCYVHPPASRNKMTETGGDLSIILYVLYVFLFAAIVWLIVSLFKQRGTHFSAMSFLPLTVVSLLIIIRYPELSFNSKRHHGLQAVLWLACSLLLYPLLANFTGIEFI